MARTIRYYRTADDKQPARAFIESLDKKPKSVVELRLLKVELGTFGDSKSVGSKVHELRIDFGPGYRIYYSVVAKDTIVLLLAAGDKSSQAKDIKTAKENLADYESRMFELLNPENTEPKKKDKKNSKGQSR